MFEIMQDQYIELKKVEVYFYLVVEYKRLELDCQFNLDCLDNSLYLVLFNDNLDFGI